MSDIFRAEIRIPQELLDHVYQVTCECGWKRDLGYMKVTAEREASWHAEKHGHDVVIHECAAPPIPRAHAVTKIIKSGQRSRSPAKIVLDVPTHGRT